MFVCFRIGSPNFLLNRCTGIATFTFVSQRYMLQCAVALQYYVKQFPIKIPSLCLMFSRDSSGISVRLSRKFVAATRKVQKFTIQQLHASFLEKLYVFFTDEFLFYLIIIHKFLDFSISPAVMPFS